MCHWQLESAWMTLLPRHSSNIRKNVTGLLPHFCCHAVGTLPSKVSVLLHEKQNDASSPNCLFIRYGGIETVTKTKSQYQLDMLHFF